MRRLLLWLALCVPGGALAIEKCVAPDGSVSYVDRCPTGTTRAPSITDPPPPPTHKGTAIIKPDPLKGFKPVPPPPGSAQALPEAPSAVKVEYYEVSAVDEASLLAALAAQGRWHARSSWKLAYEYNKRQAPGRCSVTTVATKLDLGLRLPRWPGAQSAEPALRERWKRYVAALAAHEEKRLEHARALERALGPALVALPAAPDCPALDAAARARYEALAAEARARDADLDARAQRGEIPAPIF